MVKGLSTLLLCHVVIGFHGILLVVSYAFLLSFDSWELVWETGNLMESGER